MIRALLLCPGRGSYGPSTLGSLKAGGPIVLALDAFRASLGRPTVTELDAAARFSPRLHLAGEHASLLTFACTAVDLAALDPAKVAAVAVAGSSMGWYTALFAAGALDLPAAATLVETFASYQAGNVVGGQVVYPLVDEHWRPDPALAATARRCLVEDGVYESIRFGGQLVFGAREDKLAWLAGALPRLTRGDREYPLRLPLHSAFHTPLMEAAGERARAELGTLPLRSPRLSLVDGAGRVHRPHASPGALRDWTLGAQVVEPFDLGRCLVTALGEFGPDAVLLPGPGDTLGAAVAQTMIASGWRGLRDRQDFREAQASERPPVLSMARPEQRARVVAR
jgi:acyl transferase domain-containing protein